jgi:hypothetical protein
MILEGELSRAGKLNLYRRYAIVDEAMIMEGMRRPTTKTQCLSI